MFILEICQLCGKIRILNTDEPIGSEPRWEEYELYKFGIETPYNNYEIKICDECHKPFIEGWDEYVVDAKGNKSAVAIMDMDSLHDAVIKSLKKLESHESRWVCRYADCDAWGTFISGGITHSKTTGHSIAFEGN